MKKLFLFLIFTLSILSIRAQDPFVGWRVATPTTQIGRSIQKGNFIFVESTKRIIEVTTAFSSNATATSIIASGSYRDFAPFYGSSTTLQLPTSILPVTNYTGTIGSSGYAWGALYLKGLTLTSAGQYTITVTETHSGAETHSGTVIDNGAVNMYGAVTVTQPITLATANATIVNASVGVTTPGVYCSGSLGAVFKSSDGYCYRMGLTGGVSCTTYWVSVTCP